MTIKEAEQKMIDAYDSYSFPDRQMLTEAVRFLADETHDPEHVTHLGSLYQEDGRHDLALRCYEESAASGDPHALAALGLMWKNGDTGTIDYAKAFDCFSEAAAKGITDAECDLADMYRYGQHVAKDYGRYCEMIEAMYQRIKDVKWYDEPVADVSARLAEIRREQGRTDEAVKLMHDARLAQTAVLEYLPQSDELKTMERMTDILYGMTECDMTDLGLFDLFHLFRKPCKVAFRYDGESYEAEAALEDGRIAVRFGSEWYRSVGSLLENACIGDDRLATLSDEIYGMEVIR